MKKIVAILAVAGVAAAASAQGTPPTSARIAFQVSNDGATWGATTSVNQGGLVYVRGLVSSTGGNPVGWAVTTLEDVRFTGTDASDQFALSEITNATNLNENHTGNTVGNFARRNVPGTTGVPALQLIGAGTNLVRIDNAVNPDTTGRVVFGQSTFAVPGAAFYQGFDASNPISVFGYVFRAGTGVGREIRVGGQITTITAGPLFSYFTNTAGSSARPGSVESVGGVVTIVPAPGALALLGLGGLVAGRRRR
jgi:hypothetical protein